MLSTSGSCVPVVSSDRVAMTVCEFCNGYEFFRTGALAICRTGNGLSFRMNPPGIESAKIGVEGNSTAGGVDATEFDWVKILGAMEAEDPNIARLVCRDELVLPVSSVWRRRPARRVISSKSMEFLGI